MPEIPSKFSKMKVRYLRDFRKYLKPYKRQIFIAFIALVLSALIVFVVGSSLQYFLDQGLVRTDVSLINTMFCFLILCSLVLAGTSFLRMTTTSWLSEQVSQDVRRDLFRHILSLDAVTLESLKTSELIRRLDGDIMLLRSTLNSSVAIAVRSSIQILGSLVFLALTSLKLTGVVFFIIPLGALPLIFTGHRIRKLTSVAQEKQEAMGTFMVETIRALKTVQSFCQEKYQKERFENLSLSYLESTHRRGKARALIVAFIIAIVFGAIVLTLWFGVQDVMQGNLRVGELTAFMFYAVVAAGSLNSLSDVSAEIMSALQALERIFDLMHVRPTIKSSSKTILFPTGQPFDLEFKNITFFYPSCPQHPALLNFSFKIKAGQTVALVGPSGAGKSTLFQLLLRFYEPQEGCIRVGDHDIRDLPLATLRSLFAPVFQEPDIFDLSLKDNIAFSRPHSSSEDIHHAAVQALVDTFAKNLPSGFETKVGEQGVRLSGGQKQRLAIARALLYDAPVLLLDEATNALDTENEYEVQKALDQAFQKRTRLVIAHRLATVIHANQILVLDQGQLVEQGTHQDLLNQKGLYAHLVKYQFPDTAKKMI